MATGNGETAHAVLQYAYGTGAGSCLLKVESQLQQTGIGDSSRPETFSTSLMYAWFA